MIGRVVSHYQILDQLGEGGMGVVYKARDLRLDRLVALKFLPCPSEASRGKVARFRQEAKAISALNHPNIATIYDLEEAEGEIFLVLEYLSGGTLREKLRTLHSLGQTLSMRQVLNYAHQIAEALCHAHRHGIIHRDFKTGNVLLTEDGSVKLTDFGLAKWQGSESITRPGAMAGTVAYTSPEQIEGLELDSRTDIFSFGVVLFELIASEHPSEGVSTAALMHEILSLNPPQLRRIRSDVSAELEDIISKALLKDREKRYQQMEEILTDLNRAGKSSLFLEEKSTSTITSPQKGPGPKKNLSAITVSLVRRPVWMRMVVVLAIVVLLILGGASPLGDRLWQWVHRLWQQEPKNLAVLPFTNISELPESQAFCDGLTETLTTKLTELEQSYGALSIVPAIEVRGIRGVSEAERRLGVNLVITGSVQRTAGSIRLTLNLVDTKTRRQLRSEIIDKSMADLLDLQDGVVLEVVKLLQLERKPAALGLVAAGGTAVPGAYDFYLKGTGYLQQYYRVHYSPEPLAKAIEFFQSALKADPNFAMAYSALGDALWRSYLDPKRRDPALVEEARRKCRRAIELNEGLVPAHVGLGRILNGTGQREQAIEEFKKALQLDPMNSDTYRELANVYSAMGRTHQAESTYQKAIELRPDSWPAYSYLGYFYFLQGRYLEAESQFKRVLALAPDNLTAQENLGAMYFSMGRYEEAAGVFEYLLTIEPTPSLFSNAGTVCFYQGQYAKAVEMYEKAIEGGVNDHVIWGNLADGYHMLPGSSAKAQQAYRRAIEQVEKSLQVNPRDAAAHCDLAFYLVKFGDKGRALKEVETALELDRSNVNIGVRSAVVYELAGHRDQALQSLSEAIHRGYAIKEIESEPEFKDLRKDTRYPQIVK